MNAKQFSHWLILFSLLAVLGMVVGCAPQEVSVTEADNGKSIELSQGQGLVLTLDSNITTGYEWDIVESDGQIIQPVDETTAPAEIFTLTVTCR